MLASPQMVLFVLERLLYFLPEMRPDRAGAQEPYVRARYDPYFNGLLRVDSAPRNQASFNDIHKSLGHNILRSTSDLSDTRDAKLDLAILGKAGLPLGDSFSDIRISTYDHTLSESLSIITKTTPFTSSNVQSDSSLELRNPNKSIDSSPKTMETEDSYTSSALFMHSFEKSYRLSRRRQDFSRIPLPMSAASFYNGYSPQMEIVESCQGIKSLNLYLKARRDDVNAGVPGRFLHAVIGQDVADVGTVASTITYSFYLNETLENDQFCTVPIINMRRADLNSHAELKWLLDSCQIDQSSLIFVDEVDLSYYDIFGGLKLVLLNGDKLPTKQEALKEAVIETFNCKKENSLYPWVETFTEGQDCSCSTLVAEKFALTSPEILAGQGFSRLLLAGILLDTGNLTTPDCTSKDKYMATLLLNGAGRFGCDGLYQILRYKMFDVSSLKLVDILRKDFKKWTRVGKQDGSSSRLMLGHIGMSSIGISVEQLFSHEDTSSQEIKYFQKLEKIRLLIIVSGYYDIQKNFKRELLVSTESVELMKNFLFFLNSNAYQLPLKILHKPGLKDDMRAFEVDRITSRKTIERILDEFAESSKASV